MNKMFLFVLAFVALSVSVSALNFVSDTNTQYKDGASWTNAVAVATPINARWTAIVDGTWIWNAARVSADSAVNGETVTFKKTFELGKCDDGKYVGTIDIAADNTFELLLNGNPVGQDLTEFNYQHKSTYDLSTLLQAGTNTLTIISTNMPQAGGTPDSNPAGIVFAGSADCSDNTVPEFGVVAGAVALIGALGIFIYRRKD